MRILVFMRDDIDKSISVICNAWKKALGQQPDGSVQRDGVRVSPEQGLLEQLRDGLQELKKLPELKYPETGMTMEGRYLGGQAGFNIGLAYFKRNREKFFQNLTGDSYRYADDMQGLRALVSDYLKLRDQYTTIKTGITQIELDDRENLEYKAKFHPPFQSDSEPNVVGQRAQQLKDLCEALKAKKQDTRRDAQIDKLHDKIIGLYASPYCSLQDKQALAKAIKNVKLKGGPTVKMLQDSSYQTKKLAGLYCDFAVKAKRLECLYAGKDTSEVQLREQVSKEVAKEERGSLLTLMKEASCVALNRPPHPGDKLGGG